MRRSVNGVKLGYDLSGSGEAVVFLHAFPLNRTMWAAQVAALAGRARTLAVDVRGFGDSAPSAEAFGLDTIAGDVLALARELGITRAVVVGLSMGGYVAFRVVEQAPEFVRALVLADTRAEPDTSEGRAARLMLADRVEAEGLNALQQFLQGLLGPTTRAERPAVVERVGQITGSASPPALAATLRAMAARADSRPLLAAIGAPTLVMVGEEDTLTTPESARVIAAGIRGPRLVILPRSGHLSNLEVPEAFNAELTGFLTTLS